MQNDNDHFTATNYWSDLAEHAEALKALKEKIKENCHNYPLGGFVAPESQGGESVIPADKLKSLLEKNKEYIESLIKGNSVEIL